MYTCTHVYTYLSLSLYIYIHMSYDMISYPVFPSGFP